MNPFFKDARKLEALEKEALEWRDTPFAAHAAVKHAGVDCVHLVGAILQNVSALKKIDWPHYALDSGVHSKKSALLTWLDACPNFQRFSDPKNIQPGDVVCFNLGLSEHHIGLMLDAQRVIHVLPKRRVIVSSLKESYYSRRITALYRVVESEAA